MSPKKTAPAKQWVARTFKLSEAADSLLNALSARLGLSKTGVLETLIREKAKAEGVTADEPKEG